MEPTTEASREMTSTELVEAVELTRMYPRLIAERAAREAVAAERARITAAVEAAPPRTFVSEGPDDEDREWCVTKTAVLAIVNPEPS